MRLILRRLDPTWQRHDRKPTIGIYICDEADASIVRVYENEDCWAEVTL
jgi:hypothetical protein